MTVANQTNRISAVGSGAVAQEVPFSFPYAATSDLKVYSRVTATGVETLLDETTNYTLTAASDTGGTLTTVTAVSTDDTIHIIRDTPTTQLLDLEQGGSFNAENVEDALDKNTKLSIENNDSLERTLIFPATDPTSSFDDMPNSIDRASKNLTFDSDGKPTASVVVEEGDVTFTDFGTDMAEAANAATARGLIELDTDDDVEFAGITGTTGTLTDLITKGPLIDVRAYGTVGNGVTDDTAAIQAAIDATYTAGGGIVFFPAGTYLVSGLSKTFTAELSIAFIGSGMETTKLIASGVNPVISLTCDLVAAARVESSFQIRDMTIDGNSKTAHGLYLTNVAHLQCSNVFITNANYAVYLHGSLINQFTSCHIGRNNYGIVGDEVNVTGCNLNSFTTCGIFENSEWAVQIEKGSQNVFNDCDFEVNGTLNDNTTGVVKITAVGLPTYTLPAAVFKDCWFERNYGKASVWVYGCSPNVWIVIRNMLCHDSEIEYNLLFADCRVFVENFGSSFGSTINTIKTTGCTGAILWSLGYPGASGYDINSDVTQFPVPISGAETYYLSKNLFVAGALIATDNSQYICYEGDTVTYENEILTYNEKQTK